MSKLHALKANQTDVQFPFTLFYFRVIYLQMIHYKPLMEILKDALYLEAR